MSIQVLGLSPTDKVPGVYPEGRFGTKGVNAASIPKYLLIVGQKISAGSATEDTEIFTINTPADAKTKFGKGSVGALMGALKEQYPDVNMKGIALPADPGSGAAATMTITYVGNVGTAGKWKYRLNGKLYEVTVAAGSTPTQSAVAAKAIFNQDQDCPFSADNSSGVLTLTCKTLGDVGNLFVLHELKDEVPTTQTSTIAGGTALSNGGVPGVNGAGTVSVANAILAIGSGHFDRIVSQPSDATNGGRWKTLLAAQELPVANNRMQVIACTNGTGSAANTLASASYNEERCQLVHMKYGEAHPAMMAAELACMRLSREQIDPGASMDDLTFKVCIGHQFVADIPDHATQVTALDNGVTEVSTKNGKAYVVRSITTKCLDGATPFYATLDTSEVTCTDFVIDSLVLHWLGKIKPGNPRVAADLPNGDLRKQGIATPGLVKREFLGVMKRLEQGDTELLPAGLPICVDVAASDINAEFDGTANRILIEVNVHVAKQNHQLGLVVNQG